MKQQKKEPKLDILTMPEWQDYELLDSGNGQKMERFGKYRLIRPEAEAIWKPALSQKEWDRADAEFKPSPEENGGHWTYRRDLPERWLIQYNGLKFWVMTSASRHLGIFPEQAAQWDWADDQIRRANRPLKVLNLFGYTGAASISAAMAGASVTHIDASRKAVSWAQENQQASGLTQYPVRWLVDDVYKFVQREVRRGSDYDGIIMDPPKFGRGPKGEVWEFYKVIPELLDTCRRILSSDPKFVVITAYAVKASPLTLETGLMEMMSGKFGSTDCGELAIRESSAGRYLSTAVYARWFAGERL